MSRHHQGQELRLLLSSNIDGARETLLRDPGIRGNGPNGCKLAVAQRPQLCGMRNQHAGDKTTHNGAQTSAGHKSVFQTNKQLRLKPLVSPDAHS